MRDQSGSFRAERIEERAQGGLVLARSSPDQTTRIVVHDHSQELPAALEGNLIDPDPGEPGERIMELFRVSPNPDDDRPDRPPCDPHQLSCRGFRG